MLNKVIYAIDKYKLISENDKIVVGVSGGSDSMTLLYILNMLKETYNYTLVACHINHGTRNGKSDDDARFVEEECKKLGIKLYSYEFNLEEEALKLKMSSEEAGRKLRYECFDKVLKLEKATKIATAHNANDNVETILLNIFRGTGLNGLCGIPRVMNNIIRPLCELTKVEIEDFARQNNIPFTFDYTNAESIFTRNKVRNELLPYVKDNINENVIDNINKMSNILEGEKELIEELTKNACGEIISNHIEYSNSSNLSKRVLKLDLEKLNRYHIAIKRRVLKKALSIVNDNSFKDLSFVHIESVLELVQKGTGKKIEVLNGIVCEVSYNTLMMYKDKVATNLQNENAKSENKNELIKVEKEVLVLTEETANYPAITSTNKNAIIISTSNDNTLKIDENINEKEDGLDKINNNEVVNESINVIEYEDKKLSYQMLKSSEVTNLKTEEGNNKIREVSKTKMYFDLDKLIKKTNLISNIDNEDNKISTLQKKETKIYFRFRKREDGDKILIDLFIDEKIEREERNKIVIFEKVEKDENDNILSEEIVALLGMRINPKYMIEEDTKYVLELKF